MLKFTPLTKIKTQVLIHLKIKKNLFWQSLAYKKFKGKSTSACIPETYESEHAAPGLERAIAELVKAEIKLESIKRRNQSG